MAAIQKGIKLRCRRDEHGMSRNELPAAVQSECNYGHILELPAIGYFSPRVRRPEVMGGLLTVRLFLSIICTYAANEARHISF